MLEASIDEVSSAHDQKESSNEEPLLHPYVPFSNDHNAGIVPALSDVETSGSGEDCPPVLNNALNSGISSTQEQEGLSNVVQWSSQNVSFSDDHNQETLPAVSDVETGGIREDYPPILGNPLKNDLSLLKSADDQEELPNVVSMSSQNVSFSDDHNEEILSAFPDVETSDCRVDCAPMLDKSSNDDLSSVSSVPEQEALSNDEPSWRRNVSFSTCDLETGGSGSEDEGKFVQRKNRRTDLATGREGGARGQVAQLRTSNTMALSPGARKRKTILDRLRAESKLPEMRGWPLQEKSDRGDLERARSVKQGRYLIASKEILSRRRLSHVVHKQYCLQAVPQATNGWQIMVRCGQLFETWLIRFLHWTFRQSFTMVFLTSFIGFFSCTLGFAFWIWVSGLYQPQCIGGSPYGEYETRKEDFMDAFVLSWTTFSTVGYGVIHSGISSDGDIDDVQKCFFVTAICSIEAFVGVIFASICGAILHIKVSRVQSFAQVIFSDIVCVRYGSGLRPHCSNHDDTEDNSNDSRSVGDFESYPCPILDFRIANRLHSIDGGEIIDCSVNIVASIDAAQACHTVRDASQKRGRRKKRGGRTGGALRKRQSSESSLGGMMGAPILSNLFGGSAQPPVDATNLCPSTRDLSTPAHAVEEDPTGSLVPKRIISKLECVSHDHPFFKRVFVLRHTLDHHSPLLTTVARQLVKRNRGLWPAEMNSAESVRNAIRFDHLLVSLSGTSNADANSVYAQTVYEFADVHVGYGFVNMLYKNQRDGTLRVDTGLINDVIEQDGGGGEPLHHEPRGITTEIPIL